MAFPVTLGTSTCRLSESASLCLLLPAPGAVGGDFPTPVLPASARCWRDGMVEERIGAFCDVEGAVVSCAIDACFGGDYGCGG